MFHLMSNPYAREAVKTYTLAEQTALASKTARKVRAFLHGAYQFEARYADYPSDHDVIESGGVVLTGAQLNVGTRYNVAWDFEGEVGRDCWKFRGGDGFASAVCDMEDSMADDRNIGSPASVLQMAASDWVQSFYDMMANYETYGSVVKPSVPIPQHDPDHEESEPEESEPEEYEPEEYNERDWTPMVANKWDPILARLKADQHDVECMFAHTAQRCLAQAAGTCPFKHTPTSAQAFSDGGYRRISYEDEYAMYRFYDSD
ncbi:hypothetical protein GGX14DRAFT_467050 [Mycena pura]|uniref:Uncharacterized protein n=1 Tax=Mycena pura TaxID=153505 RepID=A0AAD6V1G4_9AGAR|nr:hypothetical protein GGX14DRAFT_467050 [Mycena pura]